MELRQVPPAGRPFVEGYGADGFRIGVERFPGGAMILMERVVAWTPTHPHDLSPDELELLAADRPEIVLLGTGRDFRPLSAPLREAFRSRGIGVEAMASVAACRTYNILLSESRRVVAALRPVEQRPS